MSFENLELNPALRRAVAAMGYETATPIQVDAIPPILAGHDVVGCAQTGTGKTAAFALPTLQRVLESVARASNAPATTAQPRPLAGDSAPTDQASNGKRPSRRDPRAASGDKRRKTRVLVLAPTRELSSQIGHSFVAYGQFTPLRYTVVYGGVSQGSQVKALQHGVDVLVATPGRLLDLMQQGHVDLGHVEMLIFDEADQMLDMGFLPDLRRIVSRVPKKRQTLMFSATMPEPIRKLAEEWLNNPVSVQTTPPAEPLEKISQSVYFVPKQAKVQLLEKWLQVTPSVRTLVFARTKHGADKIVKHLVRGKIRAAAIHGNKSQNARERTLEQFKSSRPPVLVATDIAARGLDITGISHVVNYDLPEAPETYVHRIGRTGRAGATGEAVSFCSAEEVSQLRQIERLTRRRIDVGEGHSEFTLAAPPAAVYEARPNSAGRRRSSRPSAGPGKSRRPTGGRSSSRPAASATAGGGKPPATGSGRPAKRRSRHRSGL